MGLLRSLGLAERSDAGGVRAKSRFTNSLPSAAVCALRPPARVDDVLSAPGACAEMRFACSLTCHA